MQPFWAELERRGEREQSCLVGAHQMDHRLAADRVAVKPNAAVEGEAHPLAAARECAVRRLY
ncbi:MAG TPA: hypothetical protein VJN39_00525 [Gemmatimonadales bacterium]|nr:hypothetical protein [Gemmatimonadales bacterium]